MSAKVDMITAEWKHIYNVVIVYGPHTILGSELHIWPYSFIAVTTAILMSFTWRKSAPKELSFSVGFFPVYTWNISAQSQH